MVCISVPDTGSVGSVRFWASWIRIRIRNCCYLYGSGSITKRKTFLKPWFLQYSIVTFEWLVIFEVCFGTKGFFLFALKRKKWVFFALFACKQNTSKSENNESETKRTKRKIAILVKVWRSSSSILEPTPISLAWV